MFGLFDRFFCEMTEKQKARHTCLPDKEEKSKFPHPPDPTLHAYSAATAELSKGIIYIENQSPGAGLLARGFL